MRKILIVIDMQNDFIDGPLGSLEAEKIIDKVVQVIYKYPWKTLSRPVIHTARTT